MCLLLSVTTILKIGYEIKQNKHQIEKVYFYQEWLNQSRNTEEKKTATTKTLNRQNHVYLVLKMFLKTYVKQ